jgi:hypothetical protein
MARKRKTICGVEGCDATGKITKGFCHKHYTRFRKYGDPGPVGEVKNKGNQRYTYNTGAFLNEEAVSWYLLGAWMSDGNVNIVKPPKRKTKRRAAHKAVGTKQFVISSCDKDWIEMITSLICPEKPITRRKRKNRKRFTYEVNFTCPEMYDWLVSKGCILRKSRVMKFPTVPEPYVVDFIRGIWDGDGTIGVSYRKEKGKKKPITGRMCSMVSGSRRFAKGMLDTLNSLGFDASMDRRIIENSYSSKPVYYVRLKNGEVMCAFAKAIYPTTCTVVLARKHKAAQELIAEWERPIYCQEQGCDTLLTLTKEQRTTKYCPPCATKRRKAAQQRSWRKHDAKQKVRRAIERKAAQKQDLDKKSNKRAAKSRTKTT